MKELFEINQAQPEIVRCTCLVKMVKGEKVPKAQTEQPMVVLHNSVSPDYKVGTCDRCGLIFHKKVSK